MVKIHSAGELQHIKRAINQSKNESSTREDFDIESIVWSSITVAAFVHL